MRDGGQHQGSVVEEGLVEGGGGGGGGGGMTTFHIVVLPVVLPQLCVAVCFNTRMCPDSARVQSMRM